MPLDPIIPEQRPPRLHPALPEMAASLQKIADFVEPEPESCHVVVLISGGVSARREP
jgi:hypothetical protein